MSLRYPMRLEIFKRKSSQKFIPEIDALRFLAIMPVMIVHFSGSFLEYNSFFEVEAMQNHWLRQLLLQGNYGVHLFFAISGFILTLPFIGNEEDLSSVSWKKYFLRRLIRIEPPYIIAISIFLVVHIVLQQQELMFLIKSYLSSFFYIHNIVYDHGSYILPVAWSLEIEVQFYLLMPLLLLLLKWRKAFVWRLLIYAFLFYSCLNIELFPFLELNDIMIFFLGGIVAADVYKNVQLPKSGIWDIVFLVAITAFFMINIKWLRFFTLFLTITSVFHLVHLKRILQNSVITTIGGMCYSLYLLHYPLYHLFSKAFGNSLTIFGVFEWDLLLQTLIFVPFSIFCISFYFLWVEKPFMIWSQRMSKKLGSKSQKSKYRARTLKTM
ncbi:MAG: acyltransferase [Flavobacteriaceae bacterium]|nr:acyltransferase [Flavobacteriaceae bacterium]